MISFHKCFKLPTLTIFKIFVHILFYAEGQKRQTYVITSKIRQQNVELLENLIPRLILMFPRSFFLQLCRTHVMSPRTFPIYGKTWIESVAEKLENGVDLR